jgi:hypothetical protein
MSWLITPEFKSGIVVSDSDANTYLRAVETTDGQPLEPAVAWAVDSFVVGCKRDGIWSAIKACCILAGARTRLGALTPLSGAAPTSVNFADADYNRKTGLLGNGSSKYLASGRNNNADPQNSSHNAVYLSTIGSNGLNYIGCGTSTNQGANQLLISTTGGAQTRSRNNTAFTPTSSVSAGFYGMSRGLSTDYSVRTSGTNYTNTQASQAPLNAEILVFARGTPASPITHTDARLAFYSIGESIDLALLDARVTDLINAFAAAIP